MDQFTAGISGVLAQWIGNNFLLGLAPVYVGTIFLGNIAAFSALWLAFNGTFGPWGVSVIVLVLFAAEITADFLWYNLGRLLSGTKAGDFIERHLPGSARIQEYLHRNTARMIFLSKFLYSSSFVILFSVGWSRIDFKKYFRMSMLAASVWLPMIVIVSFALFRSLAFIEVEHMGRRLEVLFLAGLVIFILINQTLKVVFRVWFNKEDGEKAPRDPS